MRAAAAFALGVLLVIPSRVAGQEAGRSVEPRVPKQATPQLEITVRGAKNEEEAKARLRADQLLSTCVIKPVMTDEEIELCKTAYRETSRFDPPAR